MERRIEGVPTASPLCASSRDAAIDLGPHCRLHGCTGLPLLHGCPAPSPPPPDCRCLAGGARAAAFYFAVRSTTASSTAATSLGLGPCTRSSTASTCSTDGMYILSSSCLCLPGTQLFSAVDKMCWKKMAIGLYRKNGMLFFAARPHSPWLV